MPSIYSRILSYYQRNPEIELIEHYSVSNVYINVKDHYNVYNTKSTAISREYENSSFDTRPEESTIQIDYRLNVEELRPPMLKRESRNHINFQVYLSSLILTPSAFDSKENSNFWRLARTFDKHEPL